MTRQRITQISALFSTQQRETRKNKHSKRKKMDKMIKKLVQKTLSRYNEACDTFSSFDRESIPVDLITSYHIAQRPTDDALFGLYKMMADDTFEENKALVAKFLEALENYVIAVENIQIAFELGTMSEEEIKTEAEKIGEGQKEIFERMWCVDSVEDVNLRIYLREINHERVTQIIWPLNSLVKDGEFDRAERTIRRLRFGIEFTKLLANEIL